MRMSDYVVTRYYRAPEVILGLPYSEKVDIWSVGCIFAEMINHTVLFPGKDRIDQWTKIYSVMGTPNDEFINQLGQSAAMYVRSLRRSQPKPLSEIVPDANFLPETENPRVNLTSAAARDLLSHMLKINPDERFSVEDALNHPYVRLWFKVSMQTRSIGTCSFSGRRSQCSSFRKPLRSRNWFCRQDASRMEKPDISRSATLSIRSWYLPGLMLSLITASRLVSASLSHQFVT